MKLIFYLKPIRKHTCKHVKECNSPPAFQLSIKTQINDFINQATIPTVLNQSKAKQTNIFSLYIPTSPKEQSSSYIGSFVDEYFLFGFAIIIPYWRGESTL